jgi:DNA-binding NarL/FixJ family response regulator
VKEEEGPRAVPEGNARRVSRCLRILVVESHSLVAAALCGLLAGPPLFAVVETVVDGDTAIARLDESAFDLVVCELSILSWSAVELVRRLAQLGNDVPVVLLSSAEEEQLLLDALTCGATGFFTKDCGPDEFLDGVTSALRGHYTVTKKLKPSLMARFATAGKTTTSRN